MLRRKPIITVPNVGDFITLNCGYGGGPDETLCQIKDVHQVIRLFSEGYSLCARVEILGTGEEFVTELVP